jgi:DNA-directed RNA polymerase subunit K/omega
VAAHDRVVMRAKEDVVTFGHGDMGRFEFVRLSSLRAAQLIGGCTPRIPASCKPTSTALREVTQGKVRAVSAADAEVVTAQ